MEYNKKQLVQDFEKITNAIIRWIQQDVSKLSTQQLHHKPSPDKWSVAECLQHLVYYGDFYIPTIYNILAKYTATTTQETYTSGWLGEKMIQSIKIQPDGNVMKMKAPKDSNPSLPQYILPKENVTDILALFLLQQQQYLAFIETTKDCDWQTIKIPTTLSNWIKVRLGDILQVLFYHNERHVLQAKNVLKSPSFPS